MGYKPVYQLNAYELEPGDLVKIDIENDPILIQSIDILENGYQINYLDEYDDETLSYTIDESAVLDFYIFDDD